MDNRELLAVKNVLAEEYGITGIDDPDEVRRIFQAKTEGLNATDRYSVYTQLGIQSKLIEAGEVSPRALTVANLIRVLIVVVIAWFIWRPLAILALIGELSGQARSFATKNSLFWTPGAICSIGATYGSVLAGLVRLAIHLSSKSLIVTSVLCVYGFFATGYVGYSVAGSTVDVKRREAAVIAVAMYLLVGGLLLLL